MAKRKLGVKLSLDLIMLLVLILLLYKSNFGMAFHEIAGLAVLGGFLFHILLNWKWVVGITGSFFSKRIKGRARLSWAINFGLLVCFAIIEISGIYISKVVFHASGEASWKVLHYFCTALAMILLGIHIGLHASMLGNTIKKILHLSQRLAKILCVVLTVAIVGLGCYSFTSTSFCRWLAMPFQTQGAMTRGERPEFSREEAGFTPSDGQDEEGAGEGGSAMGEPSGNEIAEDGALPNQDKGMSNRGNMRHEGGSSSVLWNSLQMLSIIFLVATVTACLECFIKRRFKRQPVHSATQIAR